ncbi:helix-turn-helix domain-containing protein [Brevibacterium album]|uniref:helix-turn-helix domain-containing protein n=1 Tax=Brevibacterium album TaxID=417948 RepID=UPI000424F01A|nr:helix-turn-helix domain-containing protein [Brevibacterium album]
MTISDRRRRTRTALREAATTVFARQGVAGASIEEICEEGGFTRGAFYSNYSSKDELVLDIIDQVLAAVTAGASRLLDSMEAERGGTSGTTEADSAGASGTVCASRGHAVTQEEKRAILSDLLSHFRLPFSGSRTAIIASREIRVHALRNPDLQTRMDEVQRVHEAQLRTVIEALLSSHGARLLISAEDLIMICSGCHDVAADEAVAAHPEDEEVEVDTSRLLMVLMAFVRFPCED